MKRIRLENFRCYADKTIDFKPGVNLLIGDNASGKTSVLRACKYVLSTFFSGFNDENTNWISPGVDDFRHIVVDGIVSQELPIKISFNTDDTIEYPELLESQTIFNVNKSDCRYALTKQNRKNVSPLISEILPKTTAYKDYAHSVRTSYFSEVGQKKSLPLFANFSTEDIHPTKKRTNGSRFTILSHKASFGYYECLEADGFFAYWIKRLLILQEGKMAQHPEIEIVRKAIVDALGASGCNIICKMHVRPIQEKVYYVFADGREVEADQLSDGYKRLVNIVTDIAFRCALLNRGIYGIETTHRTKGTVLIDEIDLHLHPTLQASVLKGLRNAFPNIQFIVTTHAPMVMTGVESNKDNVVYKLAYSQSASYSVEEKETYGMDVSTITNVVLNQTPRDQKIQSQLDKLFELIEDNRKDEAYSLLEVMREKSGYNLPELTEAETMLHFSLEDDETDSEG